MLLSYLIELLAEEMPNRFSMASGAKAQAQAAAPARAVVSGAIGGGGGLFDPDVDVDNLVERKHHLLTRSARSNLKDSDRNIKPSGSIFDKLRVFNALLLDLLRVYSMITWKIN